MGREGRGGRGILVVDSGTVQHARGDRVTAKEKDENSLKSKCSTQTLKKQSIIIHEIKK